MDEDNYPTFMNKSKYSLYLISIIFSIIKIVLSCVDKEHFDTVLIFDLILSILFIISITISGFFRNELEFGVHYLIFYISNLILLVAVSIIHFFIYNNSRNKDFKNISLFIVIVRIVAAFFYNSFYMGSIIGY